MSADQETRLWLTMLRDYIEQRIKAALPFVRDGKLDLSSKNIVGTVPPANGGSGSNTGVTIRGATDYDNSVAPTDGQAVTWSTASGKYHPATPPTGITTLAGLSDVAISSPEDGDYLTYVAADGKWHNRRPGLVVTLNGQDVTLNGRDLTLGV